MRRRETQKAPETLNPEDRERDEDNGDTEENNKEKEGFFACYLLVSSNPRFKGHTYIGFTVNPRRRIRQHNGEIGCGAWRTKKRRPWEMVLCIYGFPTNVSALQFEWAWQHPTESLAVRKAAASFKSLSGVANKVKLAYTMLTLPSWNSINFTVNFFSTKYTKHAAGCPSLPENMKVQICCMDELPCYVDRIDDDNEHNYEEEHDGSRSGHGNEFEATLDGRTSCSTNHNKMDVAHATSSLIEECQVRESSGLDTSEGGREQFEFVVKDKNICLTTESSCRFAQRGLGKSEDPNAAETAQLLNRSFTMPYELEVIDLSTPSSSCGRCSKIKKRRLSSASSNFIDLTRSPTFVQL